MEIEGINIKCDWILKGNQLKWIGVSSQCSLNRFGKENINKNWGRGCIAGYSWVFSNKHGDCRTTIYGTLMGFWIRNRDNKVSLNHCSIWLAFLKQQIVRWGLSFQMGAEKHTFVGVFGKIVQTKVENCEENREASNNRISCVISWSTNPIPYGSKYLPRKCLGYDLGG